MFFILWVKGIIHLIIHTCLSEASIVFCLTIFFNTLWVPVLLLDFIIGFILQEPRINRWYLERQRGARSEISVFQDYLQLSLHNILLIIGYVSFLKVVALQRDVFV